MFSERTEAMFQERNPIEGRLFEYLSDDKKGRMIRALGAAVGRIIPKDCGFILLVRSESGVVLEATSIIGEDRRRILTTAADDNRPGQEFMGMEVIEKP